MGTACIRIQGALCLFLAAAIWGGMCVVSKYVLDYIPPMTLLALRLVIGAFTLLLVMLTSRSPWVRRGDLPRMVLLGHVAQLPDCHGAGHGAVPA